MQLSLVIYLEKTIILQNVKIYDIKLTMACFQSESLTIILFYFVVVIGNKPSRCNYFQIISSLKMIKIGENWLKLVEIG